VKKVKNTILGLVVKIVSAVCLFVVRVATGTMSAFGIYEPEMPDSLILKDGE